jgi:hypothetical protein
LYTRGEPRFIATGETANDSVFGRLEAKSVGTVLRATYTFTPRLTLQTYEQLFLAAGHYTDFGLFATNAPGAVVHIAQLQPYAAPLATNPDFEEGILNVNVVLRWEYQLGSLLYFVYTRAQAPSTILGTGETASMNLGAVGHAPATDVFLLKLSYWWGG